VSGGGTVLASAGNTGEVASPTLLGSASSLGNSSFDLKSGGSGFVDTIYGGVTGKGGTAASGTSLESIKGISNQVFIGGYRGILGESNSGGSSVASAAGSFNGEFTPSGLSGETGGFGSGTGSLNVTGSGTVAKDPKLMSGSSIGVTSGGGTAQTSAGGSATGSNDMISAGGLGSGSTQGNATGAIDGPNQRYSVNAGSASTGTFTGIGSGSSGNGSNQPYAGGGSVNGKASGAGTAVVNGLVDRAFRTPLKTGGDAAFMSNGDGAGFVDSTDGGALGSASTDVSGAAAGKIGGVRVEMPLFPTFVKSGDVVAYGQFSVSGNSAANGEGAFAGGFSPPQLSGPTGGSGSGTGSLNVAGAGSGGTRPLLGTAVGSGTAKTSADGSASGFNDLGSAGGLGSGASQGSVNVAINALAFRGDTASNGAGNTTGTFNNAGSGSFALPSPTSLAFP
jgi:hypothetical protein